MSGTLNMSMSGNSLPPEFLSLEDTLMKLPYFNMEIGDARLTFRDFYVGRLALMRINTIGDLAQLHESLHEDGSLELRKTWKRVALTGGYLTLDSFFYAVDCAFEIYKQSSKRRPIKFINRAPKPSPSCFAPIFGVDNLHRTPLPRIPKFGLDETTAPLSATLDAVTTTTTTNTNGSANNTIFNASKNLPQDPLQRLQGARYLMEEQRKIQDRVGREMIRMQQSEFILGQQQKRRRMETTAPLAATLAAVTGSANTNIRNASTTTKIQDPLQYQRFLMEQQSKIHDRQRDLLRMQQSATTSANSIPNASTTKTLLSSNIEINEDEEQDPREMIRIQSDYIMLLESNLEKQRRKDE